MTPCAVCSALCVNMYCSRVCGNKSISDAAKEVSKKEKKDIAFNNKFIFRGSQGGFESA